jgi:MFS family permease
MSRLKNLDYKWLVAAVFVSGLFMDLLDTTIVNVALPTLGKEFNAANTTLEWVVTGYLLSLAVWIPASGWLGDRLGTKKIFLLALFLFTPAELQRAVQEATLKGYHAAYFAGVVFALIGLAACFLIHDEDAAASMAQAEAAAKGEELPSEQLAMTH